MENVTASRSGLRDDRAFINDINKLKGILDKLEEINGDDADILSSLSETQSKLKQYIDSIPTLWPASGRISSRFGTRSDPFNFSRKYMKASILQQTMVQQYWLQPLEKLLFQTGTAITANVSLSTTGTVLAHFTAIARHFWSKRDKLSKREINSDGRQHRKSTGPICILSKTQRCSCRPASVSGQQIGNQ